MRWTTAWTAVVVMGVVAFSGTLLARRPAEGATLGFVDMDRVLNECRAGRTLLQGLQEESKRLEDDIRKRVKDVEQAYTDLKTAWAPGTAEFQKRRRELALREAEIDFDRKSGLDALLTRQSEEMARIFKDIRSEAARIGEARGLSGILQHDPSEIEVRDRAGKVMGPDEVQFRMGARTVLWRSDAVDLTDAVLDAVGRAETPGEGPKDGTGAEKPK